MAHKNGTGEQSFAAIDFETANADPRSACALGVTVVSEGRVAASRRYLIRPPMRQFSYSYIHGLTWGDVQDAPSFAEIWTELADELSPLEFLAAHNASFDRGVLQACCRHCRLRLSEQPFVCTVKIARSVWGIRPTKLPNVCLHLGIRLKHHDPASDAHACARIVLAAARAGWQYRD